MVSPADSDLVNEGSSTRRKFMDSIVSQYDKQYLEYLMAYNKVLEQRNSLLRSAKAKQLPMDLLEVYDMQLSPLAEKIYEKRKAFISEFTPWFNDYFMRVSNTVSEQVKLVYKTKLHDVRMSDLLAQAFDHDRIMEFTTVGIHKDDLEFEMNGYPVKKFGSQGQQKSFVIALKLAQHDFMKKVKGFAPLLLLDDIFDKLDTNRVNALMQLVTQENFGQVFITDTDLEKIPSLLKALHVQANVFRIDAGKKIENGLESLESEYSLES